MVEEVELVGWVELVEGVELEELEVSLAALGQQVEV